MTYNIPNGSMLIFIFLLQAAIIQSGLKLQETQSPFGAEFLNIFLVCHSFQRCALQKSLHHYFGNTCPDLQGPLSLKFGCQLVVHFLPINTNSHPLSLNFVGICESFQRADDRGKIETISLSLSLRLNPNSTPTSILCTVVSSLLTLCMKVCGHIVWVLHIYFQMGIHELLKQHNERHKLAELQCIWKTVSLDFLNPVWGSSESSAEVLSGKIRDCCRPDGDIRPRMYFSLKHFVIARVLVFNCYEILFLLNVIMFAFKLQIGWQSTSTWLSIDVLEPSKRFVCLRRQNIILVLLFHFCNIARAAHYAGKHYFNWPIVERCMSGRAPQLVSVIMEWTHLSRLTRLQDLSGCYSPADT